MINVLQVITNYLPITFLLLIMNYDDTVYLMKLYVTLRTVRNK